jgi:hypothetical protein
MGSNVDFSVPGQLTVTVDGTPQVVPAAGGLASQSTFYIDPTAWDGTHWHDPAVWAWAASSVFVDLTSEYTYAGNWAFLGNGSNAAYNFDFPTNVWLGSWGHTTAELYSSVGDFWLEDLGNWRYTETWTGTSGPDNGAIIASSRDFAVALASQQVPEPATLALCGIALAGLGAARRMRPTK